jgi:plastocyanin
MRFLLGRATPIVAAAVGLSCGETFVGTPPDYPDADVTVFVRDNYFEPNNVSVPMNGTILFRWSGSAYHNADFLAATPTDCPLINVGYCLRTFNQGGSFFFVCDPHAPGMSGQITVTTP